MAGGVVAVQHAGDLDPAGATQRRVDVVEELHAHPVLGDLDVAHPAPERLGGVLAADLLEDRARVLRVGAVADRDLALRLVEPVEVTQDRLLALAAQLEGQAPALGRPPEPS